MQAFAGLANDLREPALECHVYVLVVVRELEAALAELRLERVEAGEERVAVAFADDAPRGEHARVRARGLYVLRPQAPVEPDRVVQPAKSGVGAVVEAGHGAQSMVERRDRPAPKAAVYAEALPARVPPYAQPALLSWSAARNCCATRATWPSLICGKNGSASERAATSSQTGNSPSRWPKRSR